MSLNNSLLSNFSKVHFLEEISHIDFTHYVSNDPRKIKEYKAYKNKLYRVIKAAKKNYLTNQFEMNKENMKLTWKLIGTLINRKNTNSFKTINRLFCNDIFYADKASICE